MDSKIIPISDGDSRLCKSDSDLIFRALPIPFSFRGMLLFSRGHWLFSAWLLLAFLAAFVFLCFVQQRWIPIIETTMQSLPENLRLVSGNMDGLSRDFRMHRHNRFLSIEFLGHSDKMGNTTSDFQITLMPEAFRLNSLLGSICFDYPPKLRFDLSPSHLHPWWKSRKPLFAAAAFTMLVFILIGIGLILASVYSLPLFILAFLGKRRAGLLLIWRLAGSSLIPGAILWILAFALYASHLLGLLGLLLATALHLVVGWIYAMGSIQKIQKIQTN